MYYSFVNDEHRILLRCKVQKRFEQQQLDVLRLEQAHCFFYHGLMVEVASFGELFKPNVKQKNLLLLINSYRFWTP